MDDNTLGELATALTNELSDSISKGRTLAEQIGLIKQLGYQVETGESPELKTDAKAIDFAADDELFLEYTRGFYKNMRRKVYQALYFLCSLEEIGQDIFAEDDKNMLSDLKGTWANMFKRDLTNGEPKTIPLKKAS